jgi:hypothetical protein
VCGKKGIEVSELEACLPASVVSAPSWQLALTSCSRPSFAFALLSVLEIVDPPSALLPP